MGIEDALASMVPPLDSKELEKGAPVEKTGGSKQTSAPSLQEQAEKQRREDFSNVESAIKDRDVFQVKEKPSFPTLAPEPKPETANDPMKGYISAIGLLGAVGSMFTRRPLVAAMNASAGVLKSMKEDDAATFKQKFDEWKVQNENALKLFDYQNDTYKAILAQKNKSVDERIAEMKANAVGFKDENMMSIALLNHIDSVEKHTLDMDLLRDRLEKAQNDLVLQSPKVIAVKEGMEQIQEDLKAGKITPEEAWKKALELAQSSKGGASEDKGVLSDEQYQKLRKLREVQTGGQGLVDGMKLTELAPGLGVNNPMRLAMMRYAQELKPGFRLSEAQLGFMAKKKELAPAATLSGKVQSASRVLDESLPILENAVDVLDKGKFKDLNAVENWIREHKYDPRSAQLEKVLVAMRSTLADYAVLNARAGETNERSQERVERLLNENMNKGTVKAFVEQVKAESIAVRRGAKKGVEDIVKGSKERSFPAPPPEAVEQLKASPDTAGYFDEVFGEGAAKRALGE